MPLSPAMITVPPRPASAPCNAAESVASSAPRPVSGSNGVDAGRRCAAGVVAPAGEVTRFMLSNLHREGSPCQSGIRPIQRVIGRASTISACGLRRHSAKTSFPRLEHAQSFTQLFLAELRPHRLSEVEFCVRAFPQHEVAQPLLAACPDQQIDVANGTRIVMHLGQQLTELLARERFRCNTAHDVLCITLRGPQDAITRGIIDGDAEV